MKILYYYWVPCHDILKRGGGIRVYQENLLKEATRHPEHQCVFLSAGLTYSFDKKVRIERVKENSLLCPCYEIINSPVMSPAVMQFADLDTYLQDESVLPVLEEFWQQQGGFDVLHIQSMEGLPLSALRIKEYHPEMRVIFSLHNYSMFCPQVNLWAAEKKNCFREPEFPCCSQCMEQQSPRMERLFAAVKYAQGSVSDVKGGYRANPLFKVGKWLAGSFRNLRYRLHHTESTAQTEQIVTESAEKKALYQEYRKRNVEALNTWCDTVIAVSHRVEEIAVQMGVHPEKLTTKYIGIAFSEKQHPGKIAVKEKRLTLAYLGYARRDKGFFFLMDSILKGDPALWEQFDLLLAVKTQDPECLQLMERAGKVVHELRHVNGYAPKELEALLGPVNVGLVPVVWEDNLPQVAMELRSFGVPVLASDAGGAHELSDCPQLMFKAGDRHSLEEKLWAIVKEPTILQSYWQNAIPLPSMQEHWNMLMEIYRKGEA